MDRGQGRAARQRPHGTRWPQTLRPFTRDSRRCSRAASRASGRSVRALADGPGGAAQRLAAGRGHRRPDARSRAAAAVQCGLERGCGARSPDGLHDRGSSAIRRASAYWTKRASSRKAPSPSAWRGLQRDGRKIENCQIGVFLSYTSRRGHVILDRRLYLPESWCSDPARRQDAHVPEDVAFQTKPQLAMQMLHGAWQRGVPMAWVTGDEVHGDDPVPRTRHRRAGPSVRSRGHLEHAGVAPATRGSRSPHRTREHPRGPLRTRTRLAPGAPASTVAQWWRSTPKQWHRLAVHQGERAHRVRLGPRARRRQSSALADRRDWLLARRSVSKPSMAYYLSNAGASTPRRRPRTWPPRAHDPSSSSRRRRMTSARPLRGPLAAELASGTSRSMMALAWLASVRAKLPEDAFPYAPAMNPELVRAAARPGPGRTPRPCEEALAMPAKKAHPAPEESDGPPTLAPWALPRSVA